MYDLTRVEKEDPSPNAKVYLMNPRPTERKKNEKEITPETDNPSTVESSC